MVFVNFFQLLVEWFACILATSKFFLILSASSIICVHFEIGFFSSLFVFSCFCVSPSLLNRCYTFWIPQCWLLKCLHLFKYQKSILRHRTPGSSLDILFIFVSQVQNNQESQGSVSPSWGSNFLDTLLNALYVRQGTVALCSWERKPFSVLHECAVICLLSSSLSPHSSCLLIRTYWSALN